MAGVGKSVRRTNEEVEARIRSSRAESERGLAKLKREADRMAAMGFTDSAQQRAFEQLSAQHEQMVELQNRTAAKRGIDLSITPEMRQQQEEVRQQEQRLESRRRAATAAPAPGEDVVSARRPVSRRRGGRSSTVLSAASEERLGG